MLHRTPHPLFFPSSTTTTTAAASSAATTTTTSSLVEKDMEATLKGGLGSKPTTHYQALMEDFANFNSQNVVSVPGGFGEDFFVDQLLNFTNEEEEDEEGDENGGFKEEDPFQEFQEKDKEKENEAPNTAQKVSPFLSPPLETELLSVPAEEADLEWLSNFVEESFSTPYPAGLPKPKPRPEPVSGPTKPSPGFNKSRRSKRARTGGRVWSTSLGESSSHSSLSSETTYSDPASPNPDTAHSKKRWKKEAGGPPRRCSHCGVQRTPQWRTGPHGAKTLCNACGVRYKSGRLLPEYRPACSPTFSSELHSNSHRKVLEMRKKKESTTISGRPVSGMLYPVRILGSEGKCK